LYFFGLVISGQSRLGDIEKNDKVFILPANYSSYPSKWKIGNTVNFLMIPNMKVDCNSVLILINPKLAYSDDAANSLMVLVYSGISLSPTIIHICNQCNAR
jgi:hypothetical protein